MISGAPIGPLRACQTFIDSIGDQVMVVGSDHRILMANKGVLTALGRAEGDVIGGRCHELLHGSDRPCDAAGEVCPMQAVMKTGEGVEATHRHVDGLGETRFVQVSGSPLRDEGGNLVGTIEVMRDVTAQKEMEEALRLHNEELERLQRNREQFTATVCHEVKNLLNVVVLNAEALTADDASPAAERHAGAIIQHSRRLGTLVDDLRDATAIETQSFSIHKEPCDVVELVEQVVEAHRLPGSQHDIRMDCVTRPIHGRWDPDRLAQVVENLLSNAVKYSPEGGEIDVDIRRDEFHVRVSVADRGIGIPAGQIDQIFQPYTRIHPRFPGVGLGLFLSRSIVDAHGGEMTISSEQGLGTTVSFSLTLGEAEPLP